MKKIIILFSIVLTAAVIYAQKKEAQKKDYASPEIQSITAGSILEGNKFWYGPQNLHDGKDTSWCEGVAGDGIGQKVTINLRYESKIDTLFIKNGFNSPGDFLPNNRVKEMRVKGDEGTGVITLKDNQELQEVKLSEPVMGKTITLEILSVYKGSRDPDTCLTEIAFEKKNLTPCENIDKFKILSFRISTPYPQVQGLLSEFYITLSGDGSLNGGKPEQKPVRVNGTWTRHGNKIILNYQREVNEGPGCGAMDPAGRGGCYTSMKKGQYTLTIYNSCGIHGSSGDVLEDLKIEK